MSVVFLLTLASVPMVSVETQMEVMNVPAMLAT